MEMDGCEEHKQFLEAFGTAVRELLDVHEQQWLAIVDGDQDCCRNGARRLPHDCDRGGIAVEAEELLRQGARNLFGTTEGATDNVGQTNDE